MAIYKSLGRGQWQEVSKDGTVLTRSHDEVVKDIKVKVGIKSPKQIVPVSVDEVPRPKVARKNPIKSKSSKPSSTPSILRKRRK